MKKLFCLLLTLALLLSLLPAALAEDIKIVETEPADEGLIALVDTDETNVYDRGKCGEKVDWIFHDGVLHIVGSGAMSDQYGVVIPGWYKYREQITKIVVEEGVTHLGANAFESYADGSSYPLLKELVLADSVETIGESAFVNCMPLLYVSLGAGLKEIGDYAFRNCTGLQNVYLPEGLEIIGECAFKESGLLRITLPDSVSWVKDCAFEDCPYLAWVAFGSGLTHIGLGAFRSCSFLSTVYFTGPEPIGTGIEYFKGVNATAYYPDDGSWSESARLYMHEGSINWVPYALRGQCGDKLFWNLRGSLLTISGEGDMWEASATGVPFGFMMAGNGIQHMEIYGAESIAGYTFMNYESLRDVRFYNINKPFRIGDWAFASCHDLSVFALPATTVSIGEAAFQETAIPAFDLPDGLETIGEGAFSYTGIRGICIPSTVKSIGLYAFAGCGYLKDIIFLCKPTALSSDFCYRVVATAWYPENNGWTRSNMLNYGGTLSWCPLPTAPTLRVVKINTDGVQLTWNLPEGVEGYQLQIREKQNSEQFAENIELLAPDFVHKAWMGATYVYRLRAKIGGCWLGWSNEIELLYNPFIDVSGTKTIQYVAWAFNNGIITGTSKVTFSPDDTCTRVQFIMMLWKQQGSPEVEGSVPFTDVSGSKTLKALRWALSEGIINRGKTFDPNGAITRGQVVMILWKLEGSPEAVGRLPFTDVSGSKLKKAVLWAYTNDITKGTSPTTFAPDDPCTRVQLVVFLLKDWMLHTHG